MHCLNWSTDPAVGIFNASAIMRCVAVSRFEFSGYWRALQISCAWHSCGASTSGFIVSDSDSDSDSASEILAPSRLGNELAAACLGDELAVASLVSVIACLLVPELRVSILTTMQWQVSVYQQIPA